MKEKLLKIKNILRFFPAFRKAKHKDTVSGTNDNVSEMTDNASEVTGNASEVTDNVSGTNDNASETNVSGMAENVSVADDVVSGPSGIVPEQTGIETGQTVTSMLSNVKKSGWKDSFMKKFWLKRLDRYIMAKFLGTYFFALALILSISVVFDINENIDAFINNKAPLKAIVFDYYLNFIPYYANLFSPLFIFISVIFFTSKLAENSEIIAMFSTGMSFKRMLVPYMLSAGIIALGSYILSSEYIPKGSVTRINFEVQYKGKKKVSYARNIQLVVDTGVVAYMERYEDYNRTGYRFSLDKFEDHKLVSHLTARRATYDTTGVHKWIIRDYMIREMKGMKEIITKGDKLDTIINMEPQDFLITRNQHETLTSSELKRYIDNQKQRGFANIKAFEVEYYKRIATPFAAFILTIIGASLSSRKVKGGMGLHLGIGLGLSASYILFQTVTSTFAINGNTHPNLAVWLPNILFIGIAIYLYHKAPK